MEHLMNLDSILHIAKMPVIRDKNNSNIITHCKVVFSDKPFVDSCYIELFLRYSKIGNHMIERGFNECFKPFFDGDKSLEVEI